MNNDQREALLIFLMIGAPISLIIGSFIPSILVFPISITLFFGSLAGTYILGFIKPEQAQWKTKVIGFSVLVIVISWFSLAFEVGGK